MSHHLNAAMRADHLRRVRLPETAAAFDRLRKQRDYLMKILAKQAVARWGPCEGPRAVRDYCGYAEIDFEEVKHLLEEGP